MILAALRDTRVTTRMRAHLGDTGGCLALLSQAVARPLQGLPGGCQGSVLLRRSVAGGGGGIATTMWWWAWRLAVAAGRGNSRCVRCRCFRSFCITAPACIW